jgi:3-hydroxyisobutyrate dehydrogenase-like beta-hydroxyacid dehydrogenase
MIQVHRFQSDHGAREPLIADGAQLSAPPRDAATQGGGVLTMLANDLAPESVALDIYIDASARTAIHLSQDRHAND